MKPADRSDVAVLVVRSGQPPVASVDVLDAAGGRGLLVGSDVDTAAGVVERQADVLDLLEWRFDWSLPCIADAIVETIGSSDVGSLGASKRLVLTGGPDGRDLAPLLARRLGWALRTGVIELDDEQVVALRHSGRAQVRVPTGDRAVVTMQPRRVVARADRAVVAERRHHEAIAPTTVPPTPEIVAMHPPDVATMDLAEATNILAAGAGLDPEAFPTLERVARALGAAVGATRVVTDQGTVGHERQIGTTGVVVSPRRYVAFGISGAVQHTAGLGSPELTISVNTDAHAPMMAMSDLAIEADAPATLRALAELLGV